MFLQFGSKIFAKFIYGTEKFCNFVIGNHEYILSVNFINNWLSNIKTQKNISDYQIFTQLSYPEPG